MKTKPLPRIKKPAGHAVMQDQKVFPEMNSPQTWELGTQNSMRSGTWLPSKTECVVKAYWANSEKEERSQGTSRTYRLIRNTMNIGLHDGALGAGIRVSSISRSPQSTSVSGRIGIHALETQLSS